MRPKLPAVYAECLDCLKVKRVYSPVYKTCYTCTKRRKRAIFIAAGIQFHDQLGRR